MLDTAFTPQYPNTGHLQVSLQLLSISSPKLLRLYACFWRILSKCVDTFGDVWADWLCPTLACWTDDAFQEAVVVVLCTPCDLDRGPFFKLIMRKDLETLRAATQCLHFRTNKRVH